MGRHANPKIFELAYHFQIESEQRIRIEFRSFADSWKEPWSANGSAGIFKCLETNKAVFLQTKQPS